MSISLLNAAKQVAGESGFAVPTAVVAAADQTMFYVACAAVRALRRYPWQRTAATTTVTLTTATDYALPADFLAYVPDTMYVDGGGAPVNIPVTPSDWSALQAGIGVLANQYNCRFIGDRLHVQNPVADDVLRYEYISKHPLTNSGGMAKEMFTADDDLWVLDDELFLGELKWRWKKEKGIDDWQADKTLADRYQKTLRGQDAGAQTLIPAPADATWRTSPFFNQWR